MEKDLALAERELRSSVSLCEQVLVGETRACVCTVHETNGCLKNESGIRLIATDPRESCLNGQVAVIGAATRPSHEPFLIASGMRALGQTKHVFDLEGWVLARTEQRVSDGVFWIKLRYQEKPIQDGEREKKRTKKVDFDEVFDVYDAEYGYAEELEDEEMDADAMQSEPLVDAVVELSYSSGWGFCAPGCKVGLWGVRKSYVSDDVQWTAAGVSLVNAESSEELINEFSCYQGEITSVVHAGHIILDHDLPCLLAVAREDLLPGMQVQVWHAHPVWDGPALVLCPFSTLLVRGFAPRPSVQASVGKPLPSFCSSLPAWARVWLSLNDVAVSKHAVRALLLSLGAKEPSVVELTVRNFGSHSSLTCPLYHPDHRVPARPEIMKEVASMPTQLAPFPFAFIGNGTFVLLQSSEHVMPIALQKPDVRVPAPRSWLLCVLASELRC